MRSIAPVFSTIHPNEVKWFVALQSGGLGSHMGRLFHQPLCKAVERYRRSGLEPLDLPPGDASTGQQPGGFCRKRNGETGRFRGSKPRLRFPTGFLPPKKSTQCEGLGVANPQWVSLVGVCGNLVPARSPLAWGVWVFRRSRKTHTPHQNGLARSCVHVLPCVSKAHRR